MSKLRQAISVDTANDLKTRYAKNKVRILKDEFNHTEILPTCETFNRVAFDQLLSQHGCVGVRIYFGMDEDLNVRLVVVGVNDNDEDIQPLANSIKSLRSIDIADEPVYALAFAPRCPPECPPPPPPPPDEP